MKHILITGSNSYIGTSFERYLMRFAGEYRVDTLDMTDDSWRDCDFSRYDSVFHVSGIVHKKDKKNKQMKMLYEAVNHKLVVETAKKAKAAGAKQFVFISTTAVYGVCAPIGQDRVIDANTKLNPANWYAASKLRAEVDITELNSENFKVVIVRPPIVYGNNCKGNYTLLSGIARKGLFFPIVNNRKSMLYIDNLCEFCRLMIDNEESGVFMPQNKEYVCTSDMVQRIAKVHHKNILMLNHVTLLLRFLGLFTPKVSKAFGNLTYSRSISEYKQDYNVVDFEQSILLSEGISDD